MGYLSNRTNEIIVDAVLTKYGRQKLASLGSLGITKFGLSDDEVDYGLFNTSNPNGSDYYDTAIRKMPVLEALPSEGLSMKYRLFTDTAGNNISTVYYINTSIPTDFVSGISQMGLSYDISPTVQPYNTLDASIYYVLTLRGTQAAMKAITATGVTDPKKGASNDMIRTQQSIAVVNSADNTGGNVTFQVVGHSFKFFVNQVTTATTVFATIDAYGPINVAAQDFSININDIAPLPKTSV